LRRPLLAAALALALGGGCDALPSTGDDEIPTPDVPPPADALEERLRALGDERAPFMILSEAAMRGELEEGGAQDFSHVMHPGWCYKVLGLAEGIEDLDIRVYDGNGVLLQRDTTRTPDPYIGRMRPICPVESATYRVEVRAVSGSGAFVVQVYRSV